MSLLSGARIGPYEIVGAIGAGGMGEVYRARDTQLNRSVAIKVLPELFALDSERLARFTREAQTLASVNHPNIAQIYGLEQASSQRALVMELVEGDDLSVLIARGALPLADALPIARQIADALEAAHDVGIVHRDLKPANVKVRLDGTVKVLDFGLAKAMDPAASSGADAMRSPTMTAAAFAQAAGGPGTQVGMIIGTAAYMAPEQARGRAVDRRADIWAFGVIVFEMLTGKRAFEGDDISEVLASVLKTEPDLTALPVETPANIRRLLRRCLEKDPRKRLSAIGDARLELDEPDAATPAAIATPTRPGIRAWIWPAVTLVAVAIAIAAVVSRRTPPGADARVTRLSILGPPGEPLFPDSANLAISPDGTMVAFFTGTATRTETELWVRSLDSSSSRRIDGAEGGQLPFWSPDSRRIAFFTPTKLKTIAATGGRAETLADAPAGRGGTWSTSNVIVYAPEASGALYRIPAEGGTPTAVTTLDEKRKEIGHRFPAFLPDGRHFLFAALPGKLGKFDIFVGNVDDGSRSAIGQMDGAPVYADPGWLLYSRQGVLAAQPFDPQTRTITGAAVLLPDQPTSILDGVNSFTAGMITSASQTGTLAYFSAASENTVASWYGRDGTHTGTLDLPPGHYEAARISPDGTRAILVKSLSPSEASLWLLDLARGSVSPFSSGPGRNETPVWSPDGRRVVFAADRDGLQDLYIKQVDTAEVEQPLYRSEVLFKTPAAWSPDGQSIFVVQLDRDTSDNIWLIPADGKGAPRAVVRGPNRDRGGAPSPDGRWLAYISDETGRLEVYVQQLTEHGQRQQVSQQGASAVWWTPDGRQLVFAGGDWRSLWRVDMSTQSALRVGTPARFATLPEGILSIDATPDRTRFLAIAEERTGPGSLTIVQNWTAGLNR